VCPTVPAGQPLEGAVLGVSNSNGTRFLLNRSPDPAQRTVYTGLMQSSGAAGSYRYNGPFNVDNLGNFEGLPYRVYQPDGTLKENNFWQWSSIPLERVSSFARGRFDVSDNVRMTGQAMFSRTHVLTSLGLSADTITVWGAEIPFGTALYTGDPERGIPSSLNANGTTNADYLPGGRFGLNCNADGQAGCTESEAFPLPPEMVALWSSRVPGDPALNTGNEANLWLNRPPDYIRNTLGVSRAGENTTTTMQVSLGAEGDFPSGEHSWDMSISTGRTDNYVTQRGSARLTAYRAIATSPNFGRGFIGDPNPYSVGFAESIATCTSGLPVIEDFPISEDCITAISPDLKNQRIVTQNVFEFNLTGDLAEMRAGPLAYAVGTTYREAGFTFSPDNLSQNQNFVDPIAGLFPNENSDGEFDVKELYGELLVPIVADGPTGAEHFTLELGARLSDWSMPNVETLESWKAIMDWGFTPRYRLRGGWNRAHRAPNLAELYLGRTQLFTLGGGLYGDVCSQRNGVSTTGGPTAGAPWSANPGSPGNTPEQAAQTLAICSAMMTPAGALEYYGTETPQVGTIVDTTQPTVGGIGIQNSFGNPDLHEEEADTFTIGVAMGLLEDWTLTVDYYTIEIEDMIAVETGDSLYQRCLSMEYNPTGSLNAPACLQIYRNPTTGGGANIDRSYTNLGRARVSGVDVQINWNHMFDSGAGLNLNSVANYNLESTTQDRADNAELDWAGTQGCALQIQCQGYDYRLFTTLSYFKGAWGLSLRHQYWPEIKSSQCVTSPTGNACLIGGVQTDYQLFHLTANYRFGDKYTLRMGIENLLDEEPPLNLGDPTDTPFPTPPTHVGGGATYDPLGRRGFVSLTMAF
jgi:iron complex outermembrane recepter protein